MSDWKKLQPAAHLMIFQPYYLALRKILGFGTICSDVHFESGDRTLTMLWEYKPYMCIPWSFSLDVIKIIVYY